jgi:hypothetical protein
MPGLVGHRIDGDEVILFDVVVELGARIRMGNRNLNRFVIQALGEIDGLANALPRLPGSPMIKSPWTFNPNFLQLAVKRSAMSTVAPFLMFFRICWSPDS